MTTTLPDPVTGADAGASGDGAASVDLRAEADRLAAMPRTWAPSIGELLEKEPRRQQTSSGHDAGDHGIESPQPSTGRPPPTVRTSLADLDRVLDQLAVNDTRIAALHAERAILLAHAIDLAEALETDLIGPEDPTARRASSARRLELAHRAVAAEIATTLHLGEHATGTLTDHAVTLTSKAPATLQALHDGRLSWAHATAITTHLADLSTDQAAHVEKSVLTTILDRDTGHVIHTPTQVARRARRTREAAHPVPADVRHAEATQQRAVWLDEGRDGMAWLVAHLPAPLAHAAYDRLTRTARHLTTSSGTGSGTGSGRGSGEQRTLRTLAQARADTLTALLLDDGTLDITATRVTPGADTSTDPMPNGTTQDGGTSDGTRDGADNHQPEPAPAPDQAPAPAPDQATLAILARSIRPQVTVTVPVLTLLGITDAPATMNGHIPIDPDTARHLTALAPSLRRILTDPETGTVLSVGRTTYTVPADLKALIRARDTSFQQRLTAPHVGCHLSAQQSPPF